MQALSTAALLEAWERGLGQSLSRRALTLLAAASPDVSLEQLAGLSIGQRDTRLLTLRELTFGARLNAVTRCRECRAQLEFGFNVADIRINARDESADQETFTVAVNESEVSYRLPNSLDLAAVEFERDILRARALLLERCFLTLTDRGVPVSIDDAPAELLDAAVQHMAEVDPQGDVQVRFTCPSCGRGREIAFDIASFFWSEVDAWAARTFLDVHTLATAYGWREAEILALTPRRRQRYLDLAGS